MGCSPNTHLVARVANDNPQEAVQEDARGKGGRREKEGEPTRRGKGPGPTPPAPHVSVCARPLHQVSEGLPEVLYEVMHEVLARLSPADLAMFARVSRGCKKAVVDAELPCTGPFILKDFVRSVERLAWAKANGCFWEERTIACIANHGRLDVVVWAKTHGCPVSWSIFTAAALGGHVHVLRWCLEQNLGPWDGCATAAAAAGGGWLATLRWLREHGCEWDWRTCFYARLHGRLDVLKWARDSGCPEILAW